MLTAFPQLARKLRQRWEKLSEYPVWITFSGVPGPEMVTTRQTQAATTTLNASQIRRSVIFGRPHAHPSRARQRLRPLAVPDPARNWATPAPLALNRLAQKPSKR